MPDQHTDWKTRYQQALQAQKDVMEEHRALVAQLGRAINRVSLVCDGIDPVLDRELAGLRDLLRLGKGVGVDVLASKIDVIEERIRQLDAQQKTAQRESRDGVDRLAAQLMLDELPRELRARIAAFRKQAQERLRDGGDADALLAELAPVQSEVIAALRQPTPARTGLLGRLLGGASPAPAPAPARSDASAPPESGPAPDVLELLRGPASKALDVLADTVEPPAGTRHRSLYDLAKTRIARGVEPSELVGAVNDIRVLTAAALSRNRDEFEAFLLQLDTRLAATGEPFSFAHDSARRHSEAGNALSGSVQLSIDELRRSMNSAVDLSALKHDVEGRIEMMAAAVLGHRESERLFREEFERHVDALAARLSEIEAQSRRAEEDLEMQRRLAVTDRLTQLPNREGYARKLEEEFARWERYGRPLSLAVCDIDHFKQVNDTHGHAAGDAVITMVAQTLRETLRETDFIARYGGEEFVLLLVETTAEEGALALETLRAALQQKVVVLTGRRIAVTGSFGIAEFLAGDDPDRVFARADAALYQAKREGRNCVRVYGKIPTRTAEPSGSA